MQLHALPHLNTSLATAARASCAGDVLYRKTSIRHVWVWCSAVQQHRRCKTIVGSLHRTEHRAVAATAPPASGQAPQSPSPPSVLTHARARSSSSSHPRQAPMTDRTSRHRIHRGEESEDARVWNGRCHASTAGPCSPAPRPRISMPSRPMGLRGVRVCALVEAMPPPAAGRPWTAVKTWRREAGRQAW